MNITSSYQVRIVNCSVNLNDTVRIYQEALSYLIGVVNENWDAVKSITTGALEQQRYIEKLVHGNKNREAKYPEFDKMFHKYPSYLRRATITAAIGAVSGYRSNLANWENTDKQTAAPTLQVDRKSFPTFFRDDMFEVEGAPEKVKAPKNPKSKDKLTPEEKKIEKEKRQVAQLKNFQNEITALNDKHTVHLKVYHKNDWVWATVTLRKTDIAYLRKYWMHACASAPVLEKRFGKYSLRFSFEENIPLSKTPIKKQRICAVDLGLNTDATCCIMTADGTILARKFINFASDKDHLYHVLNRIKKFQRLHGSREVHNFWAYAKRINDELSKKIASAIVEFAVLYSADVIVFEHLDFKGKKASSKKQKIQMWRKNGIQHIAEHKAHRCGIRISHICAWGTSKLAFDGSGKVTRAQNNHSLATFESGKQYNADLNACYNIGARYFIREVTKPMSKKAWSQCKAKVPDIERRTQCTLYSLKQLHSLLCPPVATQQPGSICWDYTVLRELCGRLTPMWRPMPSGIVS